VERISILSPEREAGGPAGRTDDGLASWMLEALPGTSVVAFDPDLRVIACAGQSLAGSALGRDAIVGRRLPEVLGAAAFELYADHYARALAGAISMLEAETIDGERIHVSEFSPLRGPDGTVTGAIAVSRDVTEARATQTALAISERYYRELADESSDLQMRLTPEGKIRFASEAAGRVLGYPPAELIGQNLRELMHPDDRRRLDARLAADGGFGGVPRLEARLRHRDGSWRTCESTGRIVPDAQNGAAPELQCAIRDITERRDNEEQRWRWEQTFHSTTRGICISDAHTDLIESVNPAFARMHGGDAADFVGQPLRILLPPHRQAQLSQTLSGIDGEDFVRIEFEHLRLDGSTFPVMAEVLLTRDPGGRPQSLVQWYEDLTERWADEAAHREATDTYETAFASAPMGVALIDFEGRLLRANRALCELLGRDESELLGATTEAFTHPDDLSVTVDAFEHLSTEGTPLSVQKRYLRPDGEIVWAQTRGTAVANSRGEPSHIISHFLDITAIKVAELRQAEATARFETAFADAPIGMAIVGLDGGLVRVNRILCQLGGYSEAELLGMTAEELMHPEDRAGNAEQVHRLIAGEIDRYTQRQRFSTADRTLIWTMLAVSLVRDPDGQPLHFISQIEDISERNRLEAELRHLADHDPLTTLWNRRRFNEELERQVARCRRYKEQAALLLIDLDGFKRVNDTYGHKVGDDLLVSVSEATRNRLRVTDALSRLGGDEFAVLLTNVSLVEAESVAASIRQAIGETEVIAEGLAVSVTGSIGIAILEDGGLNDQQAYVQADAAMYRDKKRTHLRVPGSAIA
jgi:diguanylate cyclase (GGDEF)-like protein/PAS domain S-box-containing protein